MTTGYSSSSATVKRGSRNTFELSASCSRVPDGDFAGQQFVEFAVGLVGGQCTAEWEWGVFSLADQRCNECFCGCCLTAARARCNYVNGRNLRCRISRGPTAFGIDLTNSVAGRAAMAQRQIRGGVSAGLRQTCGTNWCCLRSGSTGTGSTARSRPLCRDGAAGGRDAVRDRAFASQAHLRAVRRTGLRALGLRPIFPALHRGGVFPACIPARALGPEPLAQAARRHARSASGREQTGMFGAPASVPCSAPWRCEGHRVALFRPPACQTLPLSAAPISLTSSCAWQIVFMGNKHIRDGRLLRIKRDRDRLVAIIDRLHLSEKLVLVLRQQECLIFLDKFCRNLCS